MSHRYDVAIIGSGFAGAILAWILAAQGRRVALIDQATHPRFAIGESSTPLADLLLRQLADQYDLPLLDSMSTYGSWQRHCGQLACGRKRGFSYFQHATGDEFVDTDDHRRSLLVAASKSDTVADTHWFRSDVDEFLFRQAVDAGAVDLTGRRVERLQVGEPNGVVLANEDSEIHADYLVDASGRAAVAARLVGVPDQRDQLLTQTFSTFAHYQGVRSWSERYSDASDPFDADAAAQHHLVEDGWLWMLRINNGITSVGMTSSAGSPKSSVPSGYPAIDWMMADARPVMADVRTERLQRKFHPRAGRRCWLLPTAAVTIDPLHSTGIAHALAGVQRSANMILAGVDFTSEYSDSLDREVRLIDRLVSTAYLTMPDFRRFTAACMLYFAAAIASEERLAAGAAVDCLWNADDSKFFYAVDQCCQQLCSHQPTSTVVDQVRRAIAPWNTVGLLDDHAKNRYAYTAAAK